MSDTPDYERFAYEWSNGTTTKLAIAIEYDEQTVARLKSLDWEETHRSFEPDYQFKSGREGAWTVDADPPTLSTVRDRTNLAIPRPKDCPINTRPFADGSSSIPTSTIPPDNLSRTCPHCGEDKMLSAREFGGIYKRSRGLRTELLLSGASDISHICMACERLYVVPEDTRTAMAKAMGEPA